MTLATFALVALAGSHADWQVNVNNTFVWTGKPYLPVGACISPTTQDVERAAAAGVEDVLVSLPADGAGWKATIDALEAKSMRYFVRISSPAPARDAVVVDPGGYRLSGIEKKFELDVPMPGASDALLVLAVVRDSSIRWSRRVPIVDGRLRATVDPQVQLPHVLLVYPHARTAKTPDFYDGMDEHRDRMLANLAKSPLGPGYRGMIDPLGAGAVLPDDGTDYVPTSKLFQNELSNFLENKYSSISTAVQGWGLAANDIRNFAALSRLVPLWTDTRGVSNLWDTSTEKIYSCDRKSSLAWRDIRAVMRQVALRRTKTLVDNLKNATGAPVLFSWTSWNGPYGAPDIAADGISRATTGTNIPAVLDDCAGPVSTALRSGRSVATVLTDLSLSSGLKAEDVVAETEGMGARGWFFHAETNEQWSAVASLAKARATDTSSSEWKVQGFFYPESAQNPAMASRLVGGWWWLPAPGESRRLDLGSGLEGYVNGHGADAQYVMWLAEEPKRITFKVKDTKAVIVTTVEGAPVEFKRKKGEIELLLPTTPIVFKGLDDMPVPGVAALETTAAITVLLDAAPSLANPAGSEKYLFADTMKAFDRTPGASFLRLREQLSRIAPKVAPFLWIAASRTTNTNFGETQPATGAINESVLALSNKLAPSEGRFYAEYPLAPRVPGLHEVWVAARIPAQVVDKVRVHAGDRYLGPPQPLVSRYGDGFGWYKFGECELQKGVVNFRIEAPPNLGDSLALDQIVLSPLGFRPDGTKIPTDWISGLKPVKKEKG